MLREDAVQEEAAQLLVRHEAAVELHHAAVGCQDAGGGVLKHITQGRPIIVVLTDDLEALRVFFLETGQRGADAIPAGEIETGLAPGEDPRDGAQVFERGGAGTAGRTGANTAGLDDVDRGRLAEELDEAGRADEILVGLAGEFGQTVHDLGLCGFAADGDVVQEGVLRHAGGQQLEVVHRSDVVRVFLGDALALLGHAHLALDGTLGQSVDETVGRAGPAGDGAATAVEEDDPDAVLLADSGEVLLGAIEIPEGGEDAAVLIGVGIADHHLLREAVGNAGVAAGLQRALRHRMRQEGVHDAGATLEVADGLEERDDGEQAIGVIGTAGGQAGLAGEEIDRQQVGHRAGHAHDQRPEAGGPILVDVRDEGAMTSDDGVGLRADAGLLAEERTRGAEFGIEEAEAARFVPLREVGVVLTGGGEELADGLVVEGAVLTDVEDRHMEPEGPQEAQQRVELGAGDATGADFDQGLAQEQQVGDHALGRAMLAVAEFADRIRQAEVDEVDILTPGLADVALDRGLAGFAVGGGMLLDLSDEDRRRRLEMVTEREALTEGLEALVADRDGGGTEEIEGAGGDFGRDQRVAVAVAADPSAEDDLRQRVRMLHPGGIEARLFPGLTQAQVHADHGVREDLGEEVIDVPELRLDVGLLVVELAGAPQTFEGDLDLLADRALLGGGPHVVLAADEQLVDLAMDLQDGGALGFRRVRGEDGLDAHAIEALGDLLVREAGVGESAERAAPGTGIGGEAVLVLAETLGLRGGVLLDHVQELEGDRIGLHAAIGKELHAAQLTLAHPRQGAGEILVVELLEHLDETRHHEVEVLVDFLKPAGEVVADGHATTVVTRGCENPQPQTPSACFSARPAFDVKSPWRTLGSPSPTCGNRTPSAPCGRERT